MNTERLYSVAKTILSDLSASNSITLLGQLAKTIRQQMSSPAAESVSQIESKLLEIEAIKAGGWFVYPETWNGVLTAIGALGLKDAAFVDDALSAVKGNSITLESAATAVAEWQNRLQQIQQGATSVVTGFETLSLTDGEPEDSDAELSVLMPRAAFRNELRAFSKDMLEIARFLELAEELATGGRRPVLLEELSTTDPLVIAGVSIPACLLVLKLVRDILATIKSTYELREARAKALAAEASQKALTAIDEDIQAKINIGLKSAIDGLVLELKNVADARKAELHNELGMSVPRMAARIDNGYKFEGHVRRTPESVADEATREKVTDIEQISKEISYRRLPQAPVLQLSLQFETDHEAAPEGGEPSKKTRRAG